MPCAPCYSCHCDWSNNQSVPSTSAESSPWCRRWLGVPATSRRGRVSPPTSSASPTRAAGAPSRTGRAAFDPATGIMRTGRHHDARRTSVLVPAVAPPWRSASGLAGSYGLCSEFPVPDSLGGSDLRTLTRLADGTRSRPNLLRPVTDSMIPRAAPSSITEPLWTSIIGVPLLPSSSDWRRNTPLIVRSNVRTFP